MIKIVLKNMMRRKLRTALATLGIILGVTMLVSIVSISAGLTQQTTESLGKLQGIRVIKGSSMFRMATENIPTSYMDEIRAISGVEAVAGQVEVRISSIEGPLGMGFNLASMMMSILGVEPSEMAVISSSYSASLTEGRDLDSGDRYSCVIGQGIADDYNKRVGSIIEVNGVDFRVVGIYETGASMIDSQVVVPIDIARDMSGIPDDMLSTIQVDPDNPEDAERLSRKIELRLDDVDASTQQEFSEDIGELLGMMTAVQWLFSSIAAIVGGIGVMNTMIMSVMERTREFGIMKAVGWTNRDVMKNVLMESVVIGTVGGVVGLFLGSLGARAINLMVNLPATVTFELAAQSFAFAVVLGAVGGLYPAYRASKLNPIEALRYEG
jgi:putative ABC transport system permease protein